MDDKRLERIEAKIDDIGDHLSSIDVTLKGQHVSIKDHIRRTAILEKQVIPLMRRKAMVDGLIVIIGLMASIAAIIEAIHFL